ncbi:hypothetical protein [Lewinella sp. IMCC34191]|uniref:hypothetical protein n=1 Tax=Lewinella sp. IMCC34191 TaxID=2259172 RepID=UPI000E253CE6|nr:hypothetical protein [Lewinella sp. IMCC34191]
MKTTILSYDPERYPFENLFQEFLETRELSELTASYADEPSLANSLYKNMEQSPVFKRMYSALDAPEGQQFYDLYAKFIRQEIRPQFDGPIYYQAKPSHRILFADVPGQSRFHRDADYGHDPNEINYWVPLTPAYATNTFWIESEVGQADYEPVEARPGEYVRFPGSTHAHGAKANDTGKSRVSFDFRVIPADLAPAAYREGSNRNAGEDNPVRANALQFTYCA